jgi:MSHA biogenesis protein MshL
MNRLKKPLATILISAVCAMALLNGCTPTPPKQGTSLNQMDQTLRDSINRDRALQQHATRVPKAVSDALLPPMSAPSSASEQLSHHRFDVVADKMSAKVFFTGLVEGTPFNMVVNPNVQGTVTLNLKNVTIEEAMDAVRDMYGYEYRKTSYGYEVLSQALETEIFNVNYLDVKRTGTSSTQISSGQVSNKVGTVSAGGSASSTPTGRNSTQSTATTGSVDTTSEANFWHDLESTLKKIVGDDKGRSVVANPQAGVVIVHAFAPELHQVARYLDRIQSNLQRQVILEAKILEVTLDDSFQAGVDWSLFGNPRGAGTLFSQAGNNNSGGRSNNGAFGNSELNGFDSIFTIQYNGSFRTLLRFLQTQGNVQVLSSPRISTVNNQKAVIKVGEDQFFVTGVSTSNTVVGAATIPSQDVSLTPFFSGISLDVTPQISKNGTVILHIHPSVSSVKDQRKDITLGSNALGTNNTLSLPLALSTIRESDNIVRAKNGQVVVIGGLMENNMSEVVGETPILSKLPFVGAAFRRTSQASKKTELVILLRPVLVDNHELISSMQGSERRISEMNRGFHLGGLPEVFGTEAE